MESLETIAWLPVTVIAATSLFVLREIFEFFKKRGERRRKLIAAKSLLKIEIERNYYTKNRILEIVKDINENFDGLEGPCEFSLVSRPSDTSYYERKDLGADIHLQAGMPLPRLFVEEFERWLPAIAELDKKLFESTMAMYEAISELEHLRSGLFDYISDFEEGDHHMLRGFVDYAVNQFADIDKSFKDYYTEIADTEEIPSRMR
ncbi:MAG: hypothetical protein ABJK25_13335 [Halieaceae bacterium]